MSTNRIALALRTSAKQRLVQAALFFAVSAAGFGLWLGLADAMGWLGPL